jgi:hypothetical protein
VAKTELTQQLENEIYYATNKQGTFGCFEVTIGWFGNERVDYMTYDTKGIWRCYEIKVSVADFRSKAKKTFCGHLNYYVMTEEVFEKVKDEIPSHVGVYFGNFCKKRAKKQELGIDEQTLKNSMIRSLSREVGKGMKANNLKYVDMMNRRVKRAEKEAKESTMRHVQLSNAVYEKYGRQVLRELDGRI